MSANVKDAVSRRDFIRTSAALGIGVSATAMSVAGEQTDEQSQKGKGTLTKKSQELLDHFNLKYPIFQAAPGGEDLAVAVANSGGMGAVALSWDTNEQAVAIIKRLNQATEGNYYANYVLHFEPRSLDKVLEAGCPIVQFSWGVPDSSMVARIRNAGASLGIQVSSKQNAEKALEHEPDFLICQGLEAGGHVQATSPLFSTLQDVIELAGDVPVLASGGISTGHDMRQALNAGAAGAVLGTRLMATRESDAHDAYKNILLEAGKDSTVYTICFNRDWNAAHRVLRNSTFVEWEAEGCPSTGSKPREDDVVATHPVFGQAMRYETVPPLQGHEGALEEMALYAGEGVHKVNDLPSAKELLARLWAEFENV
jgi:nitronate monooxygenase